MASVEHSTLTGASLHEPKGVDGAAANRVYVSDGLGSGSWTTIGPSVLSSTAKPFQGALLHVQDQRTSGSAAQTLTEGSYQKRELQTVVTNEIPGASLASHQITLPAGTYYADVRCTTGYDSSQTGVSTDMIFSSKIRLYNTTTSATILSGLGNTNRYVLAVAAGNSHNASGQMVHTLSGRFTLSGATVIELQDYSSSTSGSTYGGLALTTGEVEVYADILIWKTA